MGQSMEVAADKQGNALHGGRGLEEAVVLGAPAFLPEVLGFRGAELAIGAQKIGIPLAPFAGAPGYGSGRHVDHVAGGRCLHAAKEPGFGGVRDKAGVRTFQGEVAAAVVKENLSQIAVAEGAEAVVQHRRAGGVGEELRVVEMPRGVGQPQHEVVGGKSDAGVAGLVVFEVVVVVLDEMHRYGAKKGSVEVGNLGAGGEL